MQQWHLVNEGEVALAQVANVNQFGGATVRGWRRGRRARRRGTRAAALRHPYTSRIVIRSMLRMPPYLVARKGEAILLLLPAKFHSAAGIPLA